MHAQRSRTIEIVVGLVLAVMMWPVVAAMGQGAPQFLMSDLSGDKIVRFDYPSGEPVDHFVGVGISPLESSLFMVYGPDGHLYVSSFAGHAVLRYDGQSGRFLDEFVTIGLGGLIAPHGLAFGPDGDLYVASAENNRVLRYDGGSGSYLGTFVADGAGGLTYPVGLAFGPDGDLYVASSHTNSVLRFDGATGDFVEDAVPSGAGGLETTRGVLFDAAGRLYVSASVSSNIVVVEPGQAPRELVSAGTGGLFRPTQMAIGPDGALVVTCRGSGGSALRFNRTTGEFLGALLPDNAGGLGSLRVGLVMMPPPPCRVDFDGDGELTVFDFLAFLNAFDIGCP